MNSKRNFMNSTEIKQKEGFIIDYSSDEELSDLKITRVTMIIQSKKNSKNKKNTEIRRNIGSNNKSILEDFLDEKFKLSKKKIEEKTYSDEESDDEYSPSPENNSKFQKEDENRIDIDDLRFYNTQKQYKLDELNGISFIIQCKEDSIKKEINQILQNIYYDVCADKLQSFNISGYQKYVIKSAKKDHAFIIISSKCLILCIADFIRENFRKCERLKAIREKFDVYLRMNSNLIKFNEIDNTKLNKLSKEINEEIKTYMNFYLKNQTNLCNPLSNVGIGNNQKYIIAKSETTQILNLVDSFFRKHMLEKENIIESLEKLLYGLIKSFEYLEDIFKYTIDTIRIEKKIELNLKNVLVNEIWNYLINDELIFMFLKFSKLNDNSKYFNLKQKEYFEFIENGVKLTNQSYKELLNCFNLQVNTELTEKIKCEFLSHSDIRKTSIDDSTFTGSEKEDKKDSTFDNGSQIDPNNQIVHKFNDEHGKNSDSSKSTQISFDKNSNYSYKMKSNKNIANSIDPNFKSNEIKSETIDINSSKNFQNNCKISNNNFNIIKNNDEIKGKNFNNNIIIKKKAENEEDTKNISINKEKLKKNVRRVEKNDDIFTKNINISENSISFQINFDNWCRKTFKKNIDSDEDKPDGKLEQETQKEKDIFKNGNIDQLLDYINSNNNLDKKESKKHKKNKKIKNSLGEKFQIVNMKKDIIKPEEKTMEFVHLYDKEVEIFKQNVKKENKMASNIVKIKPIFTSKWLDNLKTQ